MNTQAARLVSKADAAAMLGCSTRSLDNWRNDGCPGIFPGGDCNLGMIMEWRARQASGAVAAQFAGADMAVLTVEQLEVENLKEDVVRKRIANEKELGTLILKDVALDEMTRQMNELRIAGATGIFKYAPQTIGITDIEKGEDVLRRFVEEIFSELRAAACVDVVIRDDDGFEIPDDDIDEDALGE